MLTVHQIKRDDYKCWQHGCDGRQFRNLMALAAHQSYEARRHRQASYAVDSADHFDSEYTKALPKSTALDDLVTKNVRQNNSSHPSITSLP